MPTQSKRIRIERTAVTRLKKKDLSGVWALVQRFQDTDLQFFFDNLRKHKELLRFWAYDSAARKTLIGIAIIDVIHHRMPDRKRAIVLFTSSVLVDPAYRNKNLLQRAGAQTYARVWMKYPTRPIFWLFGAMSYKSYLLLSRNFKTYWPSPDHKAPAEIRQFLNEFAASRFNESWDSRRWLIKSPKRRKLKEGIAPIGESELKDPLIRYFNQMNPFHSEGDGLLCGAPLNWDNWLEVARRALSRLGKTGRVGKAAK